MKIKTYAETIGKKPFDWNAFLEKAIAGKVGKIAQDRAEERASKWTTCACGNMCDIIPRKTSGFAIGAPLDEDLADHGQVFYTQIKSGNYKAAKVTLRKIERRSAKLIKQRVDESIKRLNGNPDFEVLRKVGLI